MIKARGQGFLPKCFTFAEPTKPRSRLVSSENIGHQYHSFLTFTTSTPMQYAAATALRAPDAYFQELKKDYMAKKAILVDVLKDASLIVYQSSGTYFVMVDHTPFRLENDITFCEYLIKEVGVVAIPPSVFYLNPEDGKNLVRFTLCKDERTLTGAVARMKEKLSKK